MKIEEVIQGDNLEVMQEIPDNSIDLIYCDILYGTGRNFNDYKDLPCKREVIEEHYYPRLKEMYRILKDTGSIYLQMDTRINHWLRIIMDEIFGYNNFRNEISWKRRSRPNNVPKKSFLTNKDVILFYSKTNDYKFNIIKNNDEKYLKHYNKIDENRCKYTTFRLVSKTKAPLRELKFNGKIYKNNYIWTQKTLDKRIEEGYIIEENSKGDLNYRHYLTENSGKILDDIWDDLIDESKVEYNTQKSEKLLERIIKASSNEGNVVADFYSGSGTTAVIAKKLNRNFIVCDTQQKAIEITNKRLNELNHE